MQCRLILQQEKKNRTRTAVGGGDDRWPRLSAEMSDLRPRDGAGMCPCRRCADAVRLAEEPVCKRCGKPLDGERAEFCLDCGKRRHAYCQGKAVFVYQGNIRQSMYRFKYANRREYAAYYAREAAALYQDWVFKNQIEVIVPVPMYRWKKRRRGYNQAETFARALGGELGLPWTPGLCAVCGTRCRRRS